MKARLVCRSPAGERLSFDLPEGEALIGREAGSTVALALEGVSRRHAVISWDGRHHWIQDMKSTNGTFVNGEPAQRERLRHLDVIGLGKITEVLFVVRSAEEAPQRRRGIVRAALVPESGDGLPIELNVGEFTLGRSAACNVVLANSAVSKFHARIDRGAERLVLTDLDSVNGTLLNDRAATSATLSHGDVISLAGVEGFRVEIEEGDVSVSREMSISPEVQAEQAAHERPVFSQDWKTRLEWDTGEMEQLQQYLAAERAEEGAGPVPEGGGAGTIRLPPKKKAAPEKPAPPKAPPSEPAPATPSDAPAARPAPASRAPAPEAPPTPQQPAPSPQPKVAEEPPPAPTQVPRRTPPAAQPREPEPAPKPAPAPPRTPAPEPPPAPAAAPAAPIREVVIEGEGTLIRITEPGRHLLGRSTDPSLRIGHPTVHRKHAYVVLAADRRGVDVEDLGGANGTFVNGTRVEQTPLQDGDRLRLGEITLTVRTVRG